MSDTITAEQQQQAKQEALTLIGVTTSIAKIESAAQYAIVANHALAVAERIAFAHSKFDPPCTKAYDAWKAMCNLRSQVIDPLEVAKKHDARLLTTYTQEQERRRQGEEDRLREQARQAAADAEKKRLEDEALVAAEEAVAAGDSELAEQIIAQPIIVDPATVFVPPMVLAPATTQVRGITVRQNWVACLASGRDLEDFDYANDHKELMLAVRAVAYGSAPIETLCFNTKWCGAEAKHRKTTFNIPGLRAYNKGAMAARPGR